MDYNKKWTKKETDLLKREYQLGTSCKVIAILLKRTPIAVQIRAQRLKVKHPFHGPRAKPAPAGDRYGRLTVIKREIEKNQSDRHLIICKCDCGKEVSVRFCDLSSGSIKSCGCLSIEMRWKPPGDASFFELFRRTKNGAKYRGLNFELTEEQHKSFIVLPCIYCGEEPHLYNRYLDKKGNLLKWQTATSQETVDRSWIYANGIDRINSEDKNIGYRIDNCNPCCSVCNFGRSSMLFDEWMSYVKRRHYYIINQNRDLLEKQLKAYLYRTQFLSQNPKK